jgi:hypothetical protein
MQQKAAPENAHSQAMGALTPDEIDGVEEPIVLRYFETLNRGDFEATSALFATDGVLQPPFETEVRGPAAIAAYLQKEAVGIILYPHQGVAEALEDGCIDYEVMGRVQTSLFSVNVAWKFIVSPQKKILLAKVKLLASLQELTKLRP